MSQLLIIILVIAFNFNTAEAQNNFQIPSLQQPVYTPGSDQMQLREQQNKKALKGYQIQQKSESSNSGSTPNKSQTQINIQPNVCKKNLVDLTLPKQQAPALSTSCQGYNDYVKTEEGFNKSYNEELKKAYSDPDNYFSGMLNNVINALMSSVDIRIKSTIISNLIEAKKVSEHLLISKIPVIISALDQNWDGASKLLDSNNVLENLCDVYVSNKVYSEQVDITSGLIQMLGSIGAGYGENVLSDAAINKLKEIGSYNRIGSFYINTVTALGRIKGVKSSRALVNILLEGKCIDCVDSGEGVIVSPSLIAKRRSREQNESYTLFTLLRSSPKGKDLVAEVYNNPKSNPYGVVSTGFGLTDAAKNTAAKIIGRDKPYPNEMVYNGIRDLTIIAQNVMVMLLVPEGEVNVLKTGEAKVIQMPAECVAPLKATGTDGISYDVVGSTAAKAGETSPLKVVKNSVDGEGFGMGARYRFIESAPAGENVISASGRNISSSLLRPKTDLSKLARNNYTGWNNGLRADLENAGVTQEDLSRSTTIVPQGDGTNKLVPRPYGCGDNLFCGSNVNLDFDTKVIYQIITKY